MTVDYLSCLEEGPNTEPEDPVLAKTDPLPTGNLDASTDTTMTTPEDKTLVPSKVRLPRQETKEEGGYVDFTGSSLNDWRPCRLVINDPSVEQEDLVQIPQIPYLEKT